MSSAEKDFLVLSKQIFDEPVNERRFEINKLSKRIDFCNLTNHFHNGESAPKYFIHFKGPLIIYSEWSNKFTERTKDSRRISIRAK